MKNFNLLGLLLTGIGSLFAAGNAINTDTEGIKADTPAVAAYVALDPTPATPIPKPTIKILPIGEPDKGSEPAPANGVESLPGVADPGPAGTIKAAEPAGSVPDKPGSPLSTAIETAPPLATPAPPPPVLPSPALKASPPSAPAYSDPAFARRGLLRRCFRCRG